MRQLQIGGLVVALCAVTAGRAAAQQIPWNDRAFANISFGIQGGSEDVKATRAFTLYEEPATISTAREVKGGGFLDIVVGGRVRGTLGAALGIARRSKDSAGTLDASLPDPVFFDANRSVSFTIDNLRHRETWIAPMAVWFHPIGEKLDLMVMAGPAFVRVQHEQADVESATVTETGGAPRLDVGRLVTRKTAAGISLGADVRYLFMPNVGVGGFLRFARASLDVAGGQSLDLGGMQLGVGVRFRY